MSPLIKRSQGVLAVVTCALAGFLAAQAAGAADVADPHAAHAMHEAPPGVSRSVTSYTVPSIKLVRDDGKQVSLDEELNDGRPVVLNFIYTTCPGICPLASHVFSQLQRQLGSERDHVHLISISVDPEEDTPSKLREYAKKYSAGPTWQHYTGTVAASIAAQRAFDVYRGDKMGHTPVTLLRVAPGTPWVRFDGFATSDMLLQELRQPRQLTTADSRTGQ